MLSNVFVQNFINTINKHDKINIFCHINPDYDTLGSGFGLKEFLTINFPNKKINVVNTSKINNIRNSKIFNFDNQETKQEIVENSLGIVVDVSSKERILGGDLLDFCDQIIIIDHHIINDEIKKTYWIDPEYPACCQMIAELIKFLFEQNQFKINKLCLEYLYAGLLTDTNRFLYDSVNPYTYQIVSWMMVNGLEKNKVHNELYLKKIKDAKRRANFLNLVKINEYGIGKLFINKKYNKKYKLSAFHDAISIMEGFEEIKIWVSCYFNEDYKTWNCSLRSREFPVVEIATKYGGGGHKLAAGCRIKHPKEFKKLVEDLNNLVLKYEKTNNI